MNGLVRAIRASIAPFRDVLHPLLSLKPRAWRRAPRYYLKQKASVTIGNKKKLWSVVILEDFSATGFSLSGSSDRIDSLLRKKKKGDQFNLTIRLTGKDWILPVTLMRRARVGSTKRAGFQVMSRPTMEFLPTQSPIVDWTAKYWTSRGFRHVAAAAWIAVIVTAILIVPSVGKLAARFISSK